MAWGDGKPEGNGETVALRLPIPPRPYGGPLNITVPSDGLPVPSASFVDRCESSSGRVRSLEATVSLCCLEAPYPSGRAPPQPVNITARVVRPGAVAPGIAATGPPRYA